MSAASGRLALIAALASAAACDGPTLEIGERIEHDAGAARDGAMSASDYDAGDASRKRDAEIDRRFCRDDRDCQPYSVHQHCNLLTGRCVDCVDNRNCPSGVCMFPEGQCLSDHGRDANEPPSNTPP